MTESASVDKEIFFFGLGLSSSSTFFALTTGLTSYFLTGAGALCTFYFFSAKVEIFSLSSAFWSGS
jgi:hypothetical protein